MASPQAPGAALTNRLESIPSLAPLSRWPNICAGKTVLPVSEFSARLCVCVWCSIHLLVSSLYLNFRNARFSVPTPQSVAGYRSGCNKVCRPTVARNGSWALKIYFQSLPSLSILWGEGRGDGGVCQAFGMTHFSSISRPCLALWPDIRASRLFPFWNFSSPPLSHKRRRRQSAL